MVSLFVMNGKELSPRQARILECIERAITLQGCPPSLRDIAKHCGYSAIGTVQDHVRTLIRKGFLEKEPGLARGLRPTHHLGSREIPILGTVPAGNPIEAIEDRRGSIPLPNHTHRAQGPCYALRVTGESMIGAGILDGDYVIVQKQETAKDGEIVVALIDGEVTVKTLEKRPGHPARLLPANPKFSPIPIPEHADGVIQGKVIGVQRYYS